MSAYERLTMKQQQQQQGDEESRYPVGEYYSYYPTWMNGIEQQFRGQQNVEEQLRNCCNGPCTCEPKQQQQRNGENGDDIYITGVSGRFPGYDKETKTTKVYGYDEEQVERMEPQLRTLIEVTREAIVDSGFNPKDLVYTNTGVFIGITGGNDLTTSFEQQQQQSMNRYANELAKYFELNSQYKTINACQSSGLIALDNAINAIRNGTCDNAIVGGIHLMDKQQLLEQYLQLERTTGVEVFDYLNATYGVIFLQKRENAKRIYAKVLNSKSTSEKDVNFTLSNGQQFMKLLREIYTDCNIDPNMVPFGGYGTTTTTTLENGGKIVESNEYKLITDVFGGKNNKNVPLFVGSTKTRNGEHGIISLVKMLITLQNGTLPSTFKFQQPLNNEQFLNVTNDNTRINGGLMALNSFGYRGTSVHIVLQPTIKQQPRGGLTLKSLVEQENIKRQQRLSTVGTKTRDMLMNLLEMTKELKNTKEALINKQQEYQLHKQQRNQVEELVEQQRKKLEQQLKIQQQPQPQRKYVDKFVEQQLEQYERQKQQLEQLKRQQRKYFDVEQQQRKYKIDEQVEQQPLIEKIVELKQLSVDEERPVWWIFNGLDNEWTGIVKQLMKIEYFNERINVIDRLLKPHQFNLIDCLLRNEVFDEKLNPIHHSILITSIQCALVDLLKSFGVEPQGIVAYSYGELTAAYADGSLTLEQTLLAALYRGKLIQETPFDLKDNSMARIGLSWQEAQKQLPQTIVTAIHETKETVIVSGPRKDIKQYVENVKLCGIQAQELETTVGFGLHSHLMTPIVHKYKLYLQNLIETPKMRTQKWLTTVFPTGNDEIAKHASADYFVQSLINPVHFYAALQNIPTNAITIEFGTQSTLKPVLTRTIGDDIVYVNLMQQFENGEDDSTSLEQLRTRLINVDEQVDELLRKVRLQQQQQGGKFEHDERQPTCEINGLTNEYKYTIDVTKESPFDYLLQHQINGEIRYPTSFYLYLVWNAFAKKQNVKLNELPIHFENVEFNYPSYTIGTTRGRQEMIVQFVKPGSFEVHYDNKVIVKGNVYVPTTNGNVIGWNGRTMVQQQPLEFLEQEEIYKEFKMRGYDYFGTFKGINKSTVDGTYGELLWNGKWIPFIESMIQMHVFGKSGLHLPTNIQSMRIDPRAHGKWIKNTIKPQLDDNNNNMPFERLIQQQQQQYLVATLPVSFDKYKKTFVSGGVEITGIQTTPTTTTPTPYNNWFTQEETTVEQPSYLERVNFVPYFERYGGEYKNEDNGEFKPNFEYIDSYLNEVKYYVNDILQKVERVVKGVETTPMRRSTTGVQFNESTVFPRPTSYESLLSYGEERRPEIFGEEKRHGVDGKLLQLLKELSNYEVNSQYLNKIQQKIGGDNLSLYKLWHQDPVFHLNGGRYSQLKSTLDTVFENIHHKQPIRILEIAPQFHSFGPKVSQILNMHPIMMNGEQQVSYHYVPCGVDNDEKIIKEWTREMQIPVKRLDWNLRTQDMPLKEEYDLVIVNDVFGGRHLPTIYEKQQWLEFVGQKLVKPQGFLMLHEHVNHFDTLKSIEKLEKVISYGGKYQQQQQQQQHQEQYKRQHEEELKKLFESLNYQQLHPVSMKCDSILSTFYLCRKPTTRSTTTTTRDVEVYINDVDQFDWIEQVKKALKTNTCDRIWLISEKQPTSGLIGLVNCLRYEPNGERIRCVFIGEPMLNGIPSWKRHFDLIKRGDLVMNVFKYGKWGSYRHMIDAMTPEEINVNVKYAHVDCLKRGDLSTLAWIQSPEPFVRNEDVLLNVCYAGLNHRDCYMPKWNKQQQRERVYGMEVSGYAKDGRFMAITPNRHGLSTVLPIEKKYVWSVPQEWTLEEAATVPVCYTQAYYSIVRGDLTSGQTVLVHHDSTPFGVALIAAILGHGCNLFITCKTRVEREHLMRVFPGRLDEQSFVDINDQFFDRHILKQTRGYGVDVVYNCYQPNVNYTFYQPTLRCITPYGGRFVQINDLNEEYKKYTNEPIVAQRNIKVISIELNSFFDELVELEDKEWKMIHQLVRSGINNGFVKPLKTIVFDRYKVQDAFRHFVESKPLEKVLIKIWEPKESNNQVQQPRHITALPKMWLSPYSTFIITGGVTPFGLQLAQWMCEHGARKIVLTTPTPKVVLNVYQQCKLQQLQETHKAIISVTHYNLKDERECVLLFKEAIEMSENGKIGGIYHLEGAIEWSTFEQSTPEQFKRVLETKYKTVYCLDKYSRQMDCQFVVFSSVEQQTAYGYANSSIERLCELRRQAGKHAIVIQSGDFIESFGEQQQQPEYERQIQSTFKTLEHILSKGQQQPKTIWSKYIVNGQKQLPIQEPRESYMSLPNQKQNNMFWSIPKGMKTPVERKFQSIFGDLQQQQPIEYESSTTYPVVDREYQPRYPVVDREFQPRYPVVDREYQPRYPVVGRQYQSLNKPTYEDEEEEMRQPLRNVDFYEQLFNENMRRFEQTRPVYEQQTKSQIMTKKYLMPKRVFEKLNEVELTEERSPLFVVHSIEGHVSMLKNWAKHMKCPVYGIQYTSEAMKFDSIEKLADYYIEQIECEFGEERSYHLVGYSSFGGCVAYEMSLKKVNDSRILSLTFLDGSNMMNTPSSILNSLKNTTNNKFVQCELLYTFVSQYTTFTPERKDEFIQQLIQLPTYQDRVEFTIRHLIKVSPVNFDLYDVEQAAKSYVQRLFVAYKYQPKSMLKLNHVLVVRPTTPFIVADNLGEWIQGRIQTQWIDCMDKNTFLDSNNGQKIATIMNDYLFARYHF